MSDRRDKISDRSDKMSDRSDKISNGSDKMSNEKNYLTMDIHEFEELPFSTEGSLEGQADPMPFFGRYFKKFVFEGDGVLMIFPKSDMRTAMAHVMERLGAAVYVCDPGDSYNYMLNLIHGHESAGASQQEGASASNNITILAGTVDTLKGLLKHSADISVSDVDRVLISDSYIPPNFAADLEESWGCKAYEHYTRPELAGLGAISCGEDKGYHVSRDLYIEIIDPETGLGQPDGKWGEIVVTALFRAKYPLIRYRTGDVSRYLTDQCRCGNDMPRIDRIKKRGSME